MNTGTAGIEQLKEKLDDEAVSKAFEDAKSPLSYIKLPFGWLDEEKDELFNEVTLNEITGVEEDILTSRQTPLTQRVNLLLTNCIKSLHGDKSRIISDKREIASVVRALPSADRTFLVFSLRRFSLGDGFTFSVDCENCTRNLKKAVDLSQLEVAAAPDPRKKTFTLTLPSGKTATWKVATGTEEEKLAKLVLSRQDKDFMTQTILMRLLDLGGKPPQYLEVRSLNIRDRNALRQDFEDKEGGIETSVQVSCENCGNLFDTSIGIGQEGFFFPPRR